MTLLRGAVRRYAPVVFCRVVEFNLVGNPPKVRREIMPSRVTG